MVSVRFLICMGAAALFGTSAYAADLPQPQPMYQPPVMVAATSGWYLRGDVGVGVTDFTEFDHSQTNAAFFWPASWQIVQKDIQDTSIFGFGVGYEVNNWLRFDVTGEYRTKAMFKATGSYTNFCGGGGICFDVNTGNYSAAVFMANAYIDLGTWWCITPYIGAGVGGAVNRITGVQDNGIISDGTAGFGFAPNDSWNTSLAWNVQAGLTYNVTNSFKVDFSYRFLSLGSPQTGVVACQNTVTCPGAFYTLKDMTSQDFRIGFRWMLQPEPPPMPLMSRG
jgi:opacity protein-like surface antigen